MQAFQILQNTSTVYAKSDLIVLQCISGTYSLAVSAWNSTSMGWIVPNFLAVKLCYFHLDVLCTRIV